MSRGGGFAILPLRYIYAVIASCFLVIAGFAGAKYLRRSFVEEFRQNLREAAATGRLPKELDRVDLDTVTPEGFTMRVTAAQETRLMIASLLSNLWFVWVPMVCAGCFGTAYLLGRSAGR
jgi:hypothetical protein